MFPDFKRVDWVNNIISEAVALSWCPTVLVLRFWLYILLLANPCSHLISFAAGQLWPFIAETISGIAKQEMNPMLESNRPAWIYSITMAT